MKRVLVLARSATARARLESIVASHPGLAVVRSVDSSTSVASLEAWSGFDDADDGAPDVLLFAPDGGDDPLPIDDSGAIPIVLVTDLPAAVVRTRIRRGVRAVVPSGADPETIVAAVLAASSGLVSVPLALLDDLLSTREGIAAEDTVLSPRETAVLRMLAEGIANKTIARRLSVSEHTVKFHISSIFLKLGVGSRTEAVTEGIRRGLIYL